jgi:CubicO group peptidase (beta-lactamase class C family)
MAEPRRPWHTLAALLALGASLAACDSLPLWMVVQQRAQIGDHVHFDAQPLQRAAVPLPLPAAPAALAWPGGADTAAAEAWAAEQGTVALLVLRRGELVYERYFNGFTRDSVGTSFSVAKSVVSALLGAAIAEGRIRTVDDPVTTYLPELLKQDPRFARITLRHLLQMRSGIRFDEAYRSPFSDASRFYLTRDLPARVAGLGIAREPGQAFSYQSGDTQLLAMAVQRAAGQPLAAFASSRLWQPMGAEFDASWSLDSAGSGTAKGFCCLNARAVDFARFGLLFLNEGRAGGRSVLPADWVRQSTAAQTGLPGADDFAQRNLETRGGSHSAFYAWQWRRAPDPGVPADTVPQPGPDFYAQGLLGQFIYVAPATQTVLVRLGREAGRASWPGWLGELARLNP